MLITLTFIFMHLADAFIQSDLHQAIHFLSVCHWVIGSEKKQVKKKRHMLTAKELRIKCKTIRNPLFSSATIFQNGNLLWILQKYKVSGSLRLRLGKES